LFHILFSGIKFFFVSQEEVLSTEKQLEDRFSAAKTIPGTQKLHRFVPIDNTTMRVYDLSQSSISQSVTVCDTDGGESSGEFGTADSTEILPGSTYIACQYDRKWWVGMVKDKSDDFDDYLVTFMTPSGLSLQYFWPVKQDICWIEKANIVCTLQSPDITSTSTRGYSFSKSNLQKAEDIFNKIHKKK
jgi:hypothetical protein